VTTVSFPARAARLLLGLSLCAAILPAHAERYRVDLIVFIDRSGPPQESPLAVQSPDLARTIEPSDTADLRAAGIEVLPDESFGLGDVWNRLRNSRNHQPVLRLAWLQKDPPVERGPGLRLRYGQPHGRLTAQGTSAVYPVEGAVALRAGRFLHLDADLVYTQADGTGELSSFRLKERRRLRREELHHLDSPRLGLLVRVQKAEGAPAPARKS
jgi:hypothetical protein